MTTETQNPNNQPNPEANDGDGLIFINGIDATTGEYLIAPLSEHETAQLAASHREDQNIVNSLRNVANQTSTAHLGGPFDVDLEDVKQAGWAIVFHKDEDQAVKDAFAPLIAHRQKQIGNDSIVRE